MKIAFLFDSKYSNLRNLYDIFVSEFNFVQDTVLLSQQRNHEAEDFLEDIAKYYRVDISRSVKPQQIADAVIIVYGDDKYEWHDNLSRYKTNTAVKQAVRMPT